MLFTIPEDSLPPVRKKVQWDVRLKAVFDNRDGALFPNQFVNTRLLPDIRHNQTIIPVVALENGQKGACVDVVKQDITVELRTVKPGITEANDVSIDEGLKPGEMVIALSNERAAVTILRRLG